MKIAFSVSARRPGCAIVQRALGAEIPSSLLERLFPAETWLTSPSGDMQVYEATDDQLAKLSVMACAAVGLPAPGLPRGGGDDDEPTGTGGC